jgi:tetratricopeptide (TPR) repeat protein
MAIELYEGPSGFAYVHITDVSINGKTELRACGSARQMDKSTYGKLEKISLAPGAAIEYGSDGALTLTMDGKTSCVVPSNVKFDKDATLTFAGLAERAVLGGKVLSSSPGDSDALPPLKPGVSLAFVAEPDVEFAEYLRAERESTIAGWQDYLSRYPAASRTAAAKQTLGSLLAKDGVASFDAYRKMENGPSQSLLDLRNARLRSEQALVLVANHPVASQLRLDVQKELVGFTEAGQKEMQAYRQALIDHKSGYSHLLRAGNLAEESVSVDSGYAPAINLQSEVRQETANIETSLNAADSLVASQRFDDALAAISGYIMFAGEEPRLAAIVSAAYTFHLGRGHELAAAQDWPGAVAQLQQAGQIQKTEEVAAALKDAERQLEAAKSKSAVTDAVQQSQALAGQRQFIQAYEVLDRLPEEQRSQVSDDIQKLAPLYVQSATQAAKELQQAHEPIRGLADEIGIQRAYDYLQRAFELSKDANLKDRMAILADKLSDYYLAQARRYLNKPLGSGVGLGWSYLDKALPYKGANLDSVRDEMTRAASAYKVRSRLSIHVVFRDQTSRRDSGGFADQLADAIATGLESSGLLVTVLRPSDTTALDPNFQLIGDVLQHRRIMVPTVEPLESKYRAGQHEIPNEPWNKANRAYEAALLDVQNAQKTLDLAQVHGKKKEIAEANQRLSDLHKTLEETQSASDSINKTVSIDIIRPYTYTRRSIDLGAVVQLQFRIADSSGEQVVPSVPILRDVHQTFTLLENVKSEDTEGVKAQGTIPDEIQFLTDVEIDARDKLIKAVCERVAELSDKVLEHARQRFADGDVEGAAESYILYLNSTTPSQGSQRLEAESFLREKFNIRSTPKAFF